MIDRLGCAKFLFRSDRLEKSLSLSLSLSYLEKVTQKHAKRKETNSNHGVVWFVTIKKLTNTKPALDFEFVRISSQFASKFSFSKHMTCSEKKSKDREKEEAPIFQHFFVGL